MKGYWIVRANVLDLDGFKQYLSRSKPAVEEFGGKYIVRGGRSENVEGDWSYERTVVLKFPTFEMVKKWHQSEEYKPIKKIREENSECNAIIIEGN